MSLVIPTHNEEDNLETLFSMINEDLTKKFDLEVVLIDDCSSDGTGGILDLLSKKHRFVKSVHRNGSPGFGLALKRGFEVASGDVIIPIMGDLSDDPRDVPRLLQKISEGNDVVFGSRFIKGGSAKGYPPIKLLFNRIYNLFIEILFNIKMKDITNAFKAYRKEVIQSISIESSGFEICAELPLKAHLMGSKMVEVPVKWSGRRRGISKFNYWRMGLSYILMAIKFWTLHKLRLKRSLDCSSNMDE